MDIVWHLKFLDSLLKIKELDEFSRAQSLLVHSFSNPKSYKGSKFRYKNSVSDFPGRNVTDFYLPNCKVEHEVKDNISAANAFSRRPYLLPGRVASILAQL